MSRPIRCLDSTIIVKFLTAEEPAELAAAADRLVETAFDGGRVIAPSWLWAEVGSVLRKKVRQRLLSRGEADALWAQFGRLSVEYADGPEIRQRAWEIAQEYGLPTLYDAVFLACTELAPAPEDAIREFWTADATLLRQLGARRPGYVRELA